MKRGAVPGSAMQGSWRGPDILDAYLECHQRFPDPIHPSINPHCCFPGLPQFQGLGGEGTGGVDGAGVLVPQGVKADGGFSVNSETPIRGGTF